MALSEAKKNSNAKWDRDNIARLSVVFRKEEREKVKFAADAAGVPVNRYIVEAVRERMIRDAASDPPDTNE